MNNVENAVERHYWRAVTFLVILILAGAGFWGLRRFAPAMFLGKPDLIAVPNNELPQNRTTEHRTPNKPALLNINTATVEELQTLPNIGEATAQRDCGLPNAARQLYQRRCPPERQRYRHQDAGKTPTFR